jgi:hypothetical protein
LTTFTVATKRKLALSTGIQLSKNVLSTGSITSHQVASKE